MALDFYCKCLNIRIHVNEGNILNSLENGNSNVTNSDPFFSNVLLVSAPNGAEIDKKMQCLSYERKLNHWRINSCLNCNMDTHAFSNNDDDKFDKIFVSNAMEQDLQEASLLQSSKSFSQIYKLLIRPPSPDQSLSKLPPLPRDRLHNQLEELKAQTIKCLNAENEFVLERIRKFENEQMSLFNELQIQTQSEQNMLAQVLINHYKEESVGNSQHVNEQSTERNETLNVAISPRKTLHLSPTKSSPVSILNVPSDDTIFVMDEEEPEQIEGTDMAQDDSSEAEDKVSDDEAFATQSDSFKMYATSLPISMPGVWQAPVHTQEHDILGGIERGKMDDPKWMAASIQALAMSVRGNDGTEMFGARPRPRLNTLD